MPDLFSMHDKTVVITGGAGYLGSALVEGFLDFGATVVVGDIAAKKPENLAPNRTIDGRLHFIACDLSHTESTRELFKKAKDLCGRIDVLINCGMYGAGYGSGSQIEFMQDDVWEKGLDGTVGIVFRCTREVIPYMAEAGGGVIVNFGSMYGLVSPDLRIYGDNPSKNPPNYGAGKAAVIQLTKYSAVQLAEKNIRVNCVCPGPFPAPQNTTDAVFVKKLAEKTILGRVGRASEIVGAVLLLASDASSYMTGANIVVDGGWTAW
jgi:NAD(P)-dependent dehydrogenase (short-subunit alcohol dehydrogenase family)